MRSGYGSVHMSGWRNWQTRTFEGRMVKPCEFKSHPRHQRRIIRTLMKSRSSYYFLQEIILAYKSKDEHQNRQPGANKRSAFFMPKIKRICGEYEKKLLFQKALPRVSPIYRLSSSSL